MKRILILLFCLFPFQAFAQLDVVVDDFQQEKVFGSAMSGYSLYFTPTDTIFFFEMLAGFSSPIRIALGRTKQEVFSTLADLEDMFYTEDGYTMIINEYRGRTLTVSNDGMGIIRFRRESGSGCGGFRDQHFIKKMKKFFTKFYK